MAPTMSDVANKAKVSSATVSRVFSNDSVIPKQTVARVVEAARQLGYHPPRQSKGRNKNMTMMIGFPNSLQKHFRTNPWFIDVVHGIENEAKRNDIMVTMRSLGYDAFQPKPTESDIPPELKDGRVDGVIVIGHAPQVLFERLSRAGTLIVAVEEGMGYSQVNCIMPDHYTAGYLSTKYLIDLGHQRIAYAGSPSDFYSIRLQTLGYQDALREMGDNGPACMVLKGTMQEHADMQTGQIMAEKILSMPEKPTAVIFGGEIDAVEALRVFQSKGLSVPDDISIIASGSSTLPIGRTTHPSLTNVCCENDETLGQMAVRRLIEIIQEAPLHSSYKVTLPVKLVEGGSTASRQ